MKRILFLIIIGAIITSSFVSADITNNQFDTKDDFKINQNYKGYMDITAVEA